MADGRKIGTLFVELSMDATKYTKAQKDILAGAEKNSADIEKTFKRVGITSDKMYDAMRQNIQNSLEAIKRSHTTTANEKVRAEQAAADKIRRINEQQFGHQLSLLDKMKQNWIATTAIVTAAYIAAQRMWSLVDQAAAYAENLETLNFLTSQYNVTGQQMVRTISENSQGLIDLATAAKVSADAIAKGFTPEQLAEMAKWAPMIDDFSSSVGSSKEAFELLVSTMAAGRERGTVQLLGATIDLKEAFGEQAANMSKAEKAMGIYNLVAERMVEIQKTGVGTTDSLADAIERYKNQIEELKLTLGDILIRMGAGLMATFQSVAALSLGLARVVMAPISALMLATDFLGITKGKAEEYRTAMEAMADAGEDLAQKAAANFELMKKGMQAGGTLATGGGALGFGAAAGGGDPKAAKKLADEILQAERAIEAEVERIRARMLKNQMDAQVFMRKEDERLLEERAKGMEEYRKIVTEANDWSVSEHQRAINKILSGEEAQVARIYELWEAGTINLAQLEEGLAAVRGASGIATEALILKQLAEELSIYEELAGFEETWYEKKLALMDEEIERLRIKHDLSQDVVEAMKAQGEMNIGADLWEKQHKNQKAMLESTYQMIDATAEMFDRESTGYKRMMQLKQAAHTVEMAMNLAKAVSTFALAKAKAAEAVAAQGTVPVAGFSMAAAMLAFLSSVMAMAGISFGGGASGGSVSAFVPTTSLGSSEQSKSIENTYELLQDTYDLEYRELTGIHESVKELNKNITGLVTTIFRTGGLPPTASGITVGGGGAEWFRSKWVDFATFQGAGALFPELPPVGGDLTMMFNKVFDSLRDSLVVMAEEFGVSTQEAMDLIFESASFNLVGKNADEVNKIVSEFFSATADNAVKTLFGGIVSAYQKLDEGLYETAQRLIVQMHVFNNVLDMTGQSVEGTIPELIAYSDHLVELAGDLEHLKDISATYYDKFFTDEEKQLRLRDQLTAGLGGLGLPLPTDRTGYRAIVEGMDLTTVAGQKAYIALLEWSDAADDYYSAVEDAADGTVRLTESLRDQKKMITDWIAGMSISSLAPVTSREAWVAEYERQKAAASAPGATTQDLSSFLNVSKQYLEFMRAFGGDYQAVFDAVMGDVEGLGDMKDAQIMAIEAADAAARIAAANQLAATQAIIAALNAGADVTIPTPVVIPVPELESYATTGSGSLATLIGSTNWFGGGLSGGSFFHEGGLTSGPSIAGESGKEWIVPTYEPQRSRFLESAPPQFWENLRGAGVVQPGGGGSVTVHVPVYLNGKVVADVMANEIPRNSNLSDAIRRVN